MITVDEKATTIMEDNKSLVVLQHLYSDSVLYHIDYHLQAIIT